MAYDHRVYVSSFMYTVVRLNANLSIRNYNFQARYN